MKDKMHQRPSTGQHYLYHGYHHRDHIQCHHDDEQVTATKGKPILIIEADAGTAACDEHTLEVDSAHHDDHHYNADGDDDRDNHLNDDGGDADYCDDDSVDGD